MKVSSPNSFIRKSLYGALVFFGTLMVLSAGYTAWNSTMSKVNVGDSLSTSGWNALVDNINDLNTRVSTKPLLYGVQVIPSGLNIAAGTTTNLSYIDLGVGSYLGSAGVFVSNASAQGTCAFWITGPNNASAPVWNGSNGVPIAHQGVEFVSGGGTSFPVVLSSTTAGRYYLWINCSQALTAAYSTEWHNGIRLIKQ